MFTLRGLFWDDTDLPLTYAWRYSDSRTFGTPVLLRSRSDSQTYHTVLPAAGLSSQQQTQNLTVFLSVYDSLDAESLVPQPVLVVASDAESATDAMKRLVERSQSSPSAETMLTYGAMVAASLSRVDCSAAPNCFHLNRVNCSTTVNTCGNCLSSQLIGEIGHQNSKCVDASELGTATGQLKCSADADCLSWEQCGMPEVSPKPRMITSKH